MASRKWNTVFATTGTINTSDQNAKTQIQEIDQAVLRAWGNVKFCQFKYRDAIARKGEENARIHIGIIAQNVKKCFEDEGVDPFKYGILCYDKWEDEYEDVKDEDGNVVDRKLTIIAGEQYGIRYEEALALECAYIRSKIIK